MEHLLGPPLPTVSPLAPEECWRLIGTAPIGRLAFSRRALPVIYPVRFSAAEGVLWFWLDTPALQEAAQSADVVCFEVDAWAPTLGGWSVLATGRLRAAATQPSEGTFDGRPVPTAQQGYLAQLSPEMVSGCRIDLACELIDQEDSRP